MRPPSPIILAAVIAALLAGCTTGAPTPAPSSTGTTTAPSAPTADPDRVRPGDPVDTAVRVFDLAVEAAASADGVARSADVAARLEAAGFTDVSVTRDRSSVGNEVSSVQAAVPWAGTCIVGQYSLRLDAAVPAVVVDPVADACLIGAG